MTKDWQSYVQMNGTLASSISEPGEGIGLSEESEAVAWAKAHGMPELGDVILDQEDMKDLGLLQ